MRINRLYDLKYQQGFSTIQLLELYPDDTVKICKIALLDLDQKALEQAAVGESLTTYLSNLKQKYAFSHHLS